MGRLEQIVVHRVPPSLVREASRVKAWMRNRAAERRYGSLVDELIPEAAERTLIVANDDAIVFRVSLTSGPDCILKLGTTPGADEQIQAECAALDTLGAMHELDDWRRLVAKVLARGTHDDGRWFTQSLLPGVPSGHVSQPDDRLLSEVMQALRPIHEATEVVVSSGEEEVFERLVAEPIRTITTWRPSVKDDLEAIAVVLRDLLDERTLTLARSHGDFAPSNVLWDEARAAVSGIIDWKLSPTLLPPELDYVHYALSQRMQRTGREYGGAVVSLLDDHEAGRATTAGLANAFGPNGLDLWTSVTLTWLQHVEFGMQKARELRTNPIWLVNNVDLAAGALARTPS